MERDFALHRSPCPHPRTLVQALARVVGRYPCFPCSPVDMVQSPHICCSPFDRSLNVEGITGKRVWLNRDAVPVPAYHRTVPIVLSAVAAISVLFIIWGVLMFDPWPALFGTVMAYPGKLWFADRMVWLWNDMQHASPNYCSWLTNKEE